MSQPAGFDPVPVRTKSEVFLNDFFSKFEDIGK